MAPMAAEAQHSSAVAGALARGDAAILLRFPHKGYREKIWDHCAGAVIVEEAGARISDASGKCLPLGYLWVQLVLAVFCPAGMQHRFLVNEDGPWW